MPRPPRADRDTVKTWFLNVRLAAEDRDLLEQSIRARELELSRFAGQPLEVSAAAYVRWLIRRDAAARGFVRDESAEAEPEPKAEVEPTRPKARQAPAPKASKAGPGKGRSRGR